MALILNIDTATETAGVCLSQDGAVLFALQHEEQKNHAAFVQPAISAVIEETGLSLNALDAIAVTAGPGSYTGLRVGLATVKGLSFTLGKPLILVNTLEVMAKAVEREALLLQVDLLCPMIDARRLEVFTALYTPYLREVRAPAPLLLTADSFSNDLDTQKVLFSGSGHVKFRGLTHHPHAVFTDTVHTASDLAALASVAFHENRFADLAYSEPFYLKDFYNPASKH